MQGQSPASIHGQPRENLHDVMWILSTKRGFHKTSGKLNEMKTTQLTLEKCFWCFKYQFFIKKNLNCFFKYYVLALGTKRIRNSLKLRASKTLGRLSASTKLTINKTNKNKLFLGLLNSVNKFWNISLE